MKTTVNDIPYCGVNEEKIKAAQPVLNEVIRGHLVEFIRDRYKIHLKKDVEQLPAPWTDNQIFQQVKFTNVRREHDRQSKFYIEKIANSGVGWVDKFWNTVMFRMFNHSNFWEHISGGDVFRFPAPGETEQVFKLLRSEMKFTEEKMGVNWFTNAFNTGGLKQSLALPEFDHDTCREQRRGELILKDVNGNNVNYKYQREQLLSGEIVCPDFEPYMPMRIIRYVTHAKNNLFTTMHEDVRAAKSQQEVYDILLKIRGFSRFLAYQVFVDLTYCETEFPFSENEFTVSGPGCDAGVNLLFSDKGGMNSEECLFWLRDNQKTVFKEINFEELFNDLPLYDRCLNVMCLENLHCELSKYVRCKEAIKVGKKPRGKVSTEKLVSNQATKPPHQSSLKSSTKKLW